MKYSNFLLMSEIPLFLSQICVNSKLINQSLAIKGKSW